MIKRKFLALLILVGLGSSCNFVEEIHFKEDGSGRLDIQFDAQELMSMMGSMDSTSVVEEAIDSTLVFKDFLREKKDSIALLSPEEQAKLKKLEPFSMRMVMKPEEQMMKFNLFSEFKNVNEVNNAFNAFQEASSVGPTPPTGGSGGQQKIGGGEQTTDVTYNFSGNRFTRNIKIINQELFEKTADSLQSAEMFLGSSTYTFKYHFPRKVKSTNVEGATFSLDGKTMTYEVNFLQMLKDPESIQLEVELED